MAQKKTSARQTGRKTSTKSTTAEKRTATAKPASAKATKKAAPKSAASKKPATKRTSKQAAGAQMWADEVNAPKRSSGPSVDNSLPGGITPYRPIMMLQEFFKMEAAGGLILVLMAVIAMIIANSPLAHTYHHLLHETKLAIGIVGNAVYIEKDVIHWINDGLMAIFFFLVGLEIKREVMEGTLSSRDQIVLPVVAAVGGMAVPGFIFYLFNQGDAEALRGWAVPTATDIAFALGVLSVLGKRVPLALKVFLLALAIIDDLGAIVIIAVFYTSNLDMANLMMAAAFAAGLFALNRFHVTKGSLYMLLGLGLWFCVLKSGVHATLAGVVTAFAIPLMVPGERRSLLRQLEHDLHSFVAFVVLPVFAFANAGVTLEGVNMEVMMAPVTIGVIAGLFIGKPLGITMFTWVFIKLGIAKLPAGMTITHVFGVALLAGIGFTMSIFIATLGYQGNQLLLTEAKLGILTGSVLSAVVGLSVLWLMSRREVGQAGKLAKATGKATAKT